MQYDLYCCTENKTQNAKFLLSIMIKTMYLQLSALSDHMIYRQSELSDWLVVVSALSLCVNKSKFCLNNLTDMLLRRCRQPTDIKHTKYLAPLGEC